MRNAPISIQNVVTYDVVVTVENRDLDFKPGMTANVTIVTERKGAIHCGSPDGALRFRMPDVPVSRKTASVAPGSGQPVTGLVAVTTGIADSLFTEIAEGPAQGR